MESFLSCDGFSVTIDNFAPEKKKITMQKRVFSWGSARWYSARNQKQQQHLQWVKKLVVNVEIRIPIYQEREKESFYQTCHLRKKKRRNASIIVYSTNVSCNFSGKFEPTCDNGMLDEPSLGVNFQQRLLQRQNIANQWPIHKLKCSFRACYHPVKKNREKPSQWLQHKTERSWSGGISFIDVFVFRSL